MTTLTALSLSLLFVACDDEVDDIINPDEDYTFRDDPATAYDRVDRIGMPAITTALIESKDDYNQATPTDDAMGDFVPEIVASLETFHQALRDDFDTLGLEPCATFDNGDGDEDDDDGDLDDVDVQPCVDQAAPLIVPDVIVLDFGDPSGFPNGRELPDPVVDVTLAVALLDLSVVGQSATTFADLPLNPPSNDASFDSGFPYLAEPF